MTKNKPGVYDCFSKAEPDEPMFVLLARDPLAPLLVLFWAELRAIVGEDPEMIAEARACADAMAEWLVKNRQDKLARFAKALRGPGHERRMGNAAGRINAMLDKLELHFARMEGDE
jgi:hypothetical protein